MKLKVIGAIALAVLVFLWWNSRSDRNRGRDDERNVRADSLRAAALDSMSAVRKRDSLRIFYIEVEKARLQRERDLATVRANKLSAELQRIRRTPDGGGYIRTDTLEVIGPVTLSLIDSLASDGEKLRRDVKQWVAFSDTLMVAIIDLRKANVQAVEALIESEREVGRLKRAKSSGWRDRIKPKVTAGYNATFVRADGSVKHGPGLSVGWQLWP